MSRSRLDMHELMGEHGEGELNLTPYLDIITTLVIFMIFTFQVVIEFKLIDVFVPQYGGKSASAQEDPTKPQITVTLIVSETGYRVLASDGVAPSEIPKIPNPDPKSDEKMVYDTKALNETLVTWKEKLGLGESLILLATDSTEYRAIVATMDAVRMNGSKMLFPDVALGTASAGGGN
jgi:biopolymer transport protein ExbD